MARIFAYPAFAQRVGLSHPTISIGVVREPSYHEDTKSTEPTKFQLVFRVLRVASAMGSRGLNGAVSEPAWKSKPIRYLVSTEDRMIPPYAQDRSSSAA